MSSRRIVITGVSSGLGEALLRAYAEQGHRVYGCARQSDALESLRPLGGVEVAAVDVRDDAAVRAWAESIPAVDLVVANAGVSPESNRGPWVWETSAEDFDLTLAVNVSGVANTARHFIPKMLAAKKGVFVAISSGLGRSTNPHVGAYCASKFAVEGLVKSLAMALPPPLCAVPLAPGLVATGTEGSELPDAETWAREAGPLILSLSRADNGTSLSVPGFYPDKYTHTWIINDGQELPSVGCEFFGRDCDSHVARRVQSRAEVA